jgi:glycosyltransferase involved in cell wall biosynthesis
MPEIDLAVLGQDPRFGGGAAAQMAAFMTGAVEIGRRPQLFFVSHPALTEEPVRLRELDVPGVQVPLARLAAAQQVLGGRRLAREIHGARSTWVSATTASYGAAAATSGRPFGCWIGTTLAAEARAQRRDLPWSRRVAATINSPVLRRIERDVLRRAEAVHATSISSRAEIAEASGLAESEIRLLPIPVDTTAFAPVSDDCWRENLRAPTLVFVGRATDPRKNVSLLLRAFRGIRKTMPEARLVLVGIPPHCALPDGATALGYVSDLPRVLAASTLFVLPSLQEGFGIVVAEALAAGIPVLTTPCGGPEEMVRISGGGTVLSGFGAEEFAAAAIGMLGDTGALTAARAQARDFAERELSLDRFSARLRRAVDEVDAAAPPA